MSDDDLDALLDGALDEVDRTEAEGQAARAAAQEASAAAAAQQQALPGGFPGLGGAGGDNPLAALAGLLPQGGAAGLNENASPEDRKLMENVQMLMQALSKAAASPENGGEEGLDDMNNAIKKCIGALQEDDNGTPEEKERLAKLSTMLDKVNSATGADGDGAAQQGGDGGGISNEDMTEMLQELMKDIQPAPSSTGVEGAANGGSSLPSLPDLPAMPSEQMTEEQAKEFFEKFQAAIQQQPEAMEAAAKHQKDSAAEAQQREAEVAMMQSLLGDPEKIIGPFRDLSAHYPQWLAENKATQTVEEFDRFTAQFETMSDILKLFEDGNLFAEAAKQQSEEEATARPTEENAEASSSTEAKINTFMALVDRLQQLGAPPPDLVAKVNAAE